ncbi:cupin domain-containing protein [Streptomyces sp. VRA16 Mangrove soil]|uniref:cupin domain-containing protein n=1 Tax=Streptomyces sp. VRA16 Mangrove soil TaxID=2817434 RepID=UPI001A9FA151|nr:cupin domain-containing protein [Streptomyces sp. VRA16 Mangrove soil]MBO1330599.1 cupin domain-containing protein [Streptomyces sp. VRA16 Mangrove soil]
MPAAHVTLADVLAAAEADATGALWRLEGAARQLDANVIRLRPRASGTPHVEPDLDVLLFVAEGHGTLHRAGTEEEMTPGTLLFVPRGEQRAVTAGDDGLVYLTAHRRRPGMTIHRATTPVTAEGGEAPCLLPRICEECGRAAEDPAAAYCGRCGKRLPTQSSGLS